MVVLAMLLVGHQKVDVPPIGHVAGFFVGVTTKEQFERSHGKGLAFTGGHPHGGRTWYDPGLHIRISIDPFNYSDNGAVVDGVGIEWVDEKDLEPHVPRIHLKKSQLGILAKLRRGMLTQEVEKALHLKFVGGKATQKGLVKYRQRLVNWDKDRYTTWTISIGADKRLTAFDVLSE
ncbi:MAG: hypothetical protein JST51_08070 [Armatimonadetes bacterium]|nr:hypothetical protein [Armatimonadota bacterium]